MLKPELCTVEIKWDNSKTLTSPKCFNLKQDKNVTDMSSVKGGRQKHGKLFISIRTSNSNFKHWNEPTKCAVTVSQAMEFRRFAYFTTTIQFLNYKLSPISIF